jgi:outer membrane protein OmpA-like peptidoglycan-associated protein
MAPAGPQPNVASVTCELEALPKVGNIVGGLIDAASNAPVPSASVKITDKLGRELELSADASGAFRFENVPPGAAKITVTAEGYLPSVTELEVKPQEDLRASISLNKRPKRANVVVAARELKLRKQVHFAHDSADIDPDSDALVQEIADVLNKRADITHLEIQGHTDNTGSPIYNQRLSQQRADAVRDALIKLGIDAGRLDAKGYGQEKPLVPNVSAANRARNRRVQLMIKK